jgi:hypothetical protein
MIGVGSATMLQCRIRLKNRMASERLQMTLNRGGEPSSGAASGSGRNGFEAFKRIEQRVSTERSQPTCPLYPYMDVEVAVLCRHPESIRATDRSHGG